MTLSFLEKTGKNLLFRLGPQQTSVALEASLPPKSGNDKNNLRHTLLAAHSGLQSKAKRKLLFQDNRPCEIPLHKWQSWFFQVWEGHSCSSTLHLFAAYLYSTFQKARNLRGSSKRPTFWKRGNNIANRIAIHCKWHKPLHEESRGKVFYPLLKNQTMLVVVAETYQSKQAGKATLCELKIVLYTSRCSVREITCWLNFISLLL